MTTQRGVARAEPRAGVCRASWLRTRDQRRHFTNPVEQHRWLSEVLTETEQARLAMFLELSTALEERAEAEVPPPGRSADVHEPSAALALKRCRAIIAASRAFSLWG
jgi:hypothetical protein